MNISAFFSIFYPRYIFRISIFYTVETSITSNPYPFEDICHSHFPYLLIVEKKEVKEEGEEKR